MRNMAEIIELIRTKKNLKSESQVATILGLHRNSLSRFKITPDSYPYKELLKFCWQEKISVDWLLFGHEMIEFNPAVDRITRWLSEHPDDAEAILKIIEGREAMERLKKG